LFISILFIFILWGGGRTAVAVIGGGGGERGVLLLLRFESKDVVPAPPCPDGVFHAFGECVVFRVALGGGHGNREHEALPAPHLLEELAGGDDRELAVVPSHLTHPLGGW